MIREPVYLHDSFTKSRLDIREIVTDEVKMYLCGPTVYDRIHIGNARPLVVFDVLRRFLRSEGLDVHMVRNITDIDDKIIERSKIREISTVQLTTETTRWYQQDCQDLGLEEVEHEPRASEYIPQMQELIAKLIQRQHAYVVKGGVYFATKSFRGYGELSGRCLQEQLSSDEEEGRHKRDQLDFALWKGWSGEVYEPYWESPWGRGRPGWHIECSAMSSHLLGQDFHIHGGGNDLLFPHHENERAQNLCAFPDSKFARLWIHNGYVLVDGAKMSKSLGNFYTLREILDSNHADSIRLLLLSTHYRKPLDFKLENLKEADKKRKLLQRALEKITAASPPQTTFTKPASEMTSNPLREHLGNDLNTPLALSYLYQEARSIIQGNIRVESVSNFMQSLYVLGLLQNNEKDTSLSGGDMQKSMEIQTSVEIQKLINRRQELRQKRQYEEADEIRKRLLKQGIILSDGTHGTTWERS